MGPFLLTSAGFENPRIGEEFLKLVGKPTAAIRVLIIPTAAITDEQRKYVDISRIELLDMGIHEENVVMSPPGEPACYAPPEEFDAWYVCGGNASHLPKVFVTTGFEKRIRQFLDKGGLYVGVSAESIVVGPQVADGEGLKLVDTIIVPHYSDENPERRARVEKLRAETRYPVVPLGITRLCLSKRANPRWWNRAGAMVGAMVGSAVLLRVSRCRRRLFGRLPFMCTQKGPALRDRSRDSSKAGPMLCAH